MVLAKKFYSFHIQPQDVDFQQKATLASIVNILLTTAGYNADDNGFGLRTLNAMESSWVLLRMAVEMDYFPEQYEEIHVETWIEEVGRATTTRNFSIWNGNHEIIGNACSNWAMIDMKTRRAKDLITLEGIQQFATDELSRIEKPIKLNNLDTIKPVEQFKIKYSDIDLNQHVNSTRYVEWISDYFSLDTYKEKNIKRFEINFVNEMLFDDEVSIFASEILENDFRFEMRSKDKSTCRARMVFR
jgi:medium-chain acyl-[acyl-carrier-protein] hydrolase